MADDCQNEALILRLHGRVIRCAPLTEQEFSQYIRELAELEGVQ